MNIGYLSDYRLITLKAVRAIDTSISRAIQTTSRYDFRANDIRPEKKMIILIYLLKTLIVGIQSMFQIKKKKRKKKENRYTPVYHSFIIYKSGN